MKFLHRDDYDRNQTIRVEPRWNNGNTRSMCATCSNFTLKTQERRRSRRSDLFIVNFDHIHIMALAFSLLAFNKYMMVG